MLQTSTKVHTTRTVFYWETVPPVMYMRVLYHSKALPLTQQHKLPDTQIYICPSLFYCHTVWIFVWCNIRDKWALQLVYGGLVSGHKGSLAPTPHPAPPKQINTKLEMPETWQHKLYITTFYAPCQARGRQHHAAGSQAVYKHVRGSLLQFFPNPILSAFSPLYTQLLCFHCLWAAVTGSSATAALA